MNEESHILIEFTWTSMNTQDLNYRSRFHDELKFDSHWTSFQFHVFMICLLNKMASKMVCEHESNRPDWVSPHYSRTDDSAPGLPALCSLIQSLACEEPRGQIHWETAVLRGRGVKERETFHSCSHRLFIHSQWGLQFFILSQWGLQFFIHSQWGLQFFIHSQWGLQFFILSQWGLQFFIHSQWGLQFFIHSQWELQFFIHSQWGLQLFIHSQWGLQFFILSQWGLQFFIHSQWGLQLFIHSQWGLQFFILSQWGLQFFIHSQWGLQLFRCPLKDIQASNRFTWTNVLVTPLHKALILPVCQAISKINAYAYLNKSFKSTKENKTLYIYIYIKCLF